MDVKINGSYWTC